MATGGNVLKSRGEASALDGLPFAASNPQFVKFGNTLHTHLHQQHSSTLTIPFPSSLSLFSPVISTLTFQIRLTASQQAAMAAAAEGGAAALKYSTADVTVAHCDMPEELKALAIKTTIEALSTDKVEKDQAIDIKKTMEDYNGGMWHVIIGTSFGLSVNHENNSILMLRIGKLNILVFQTFEESTLVRKDGGAARVGRGVGGKKAEEEEE